MGSLFINGSLLVYNNSAAGSAISFSGSDSGLRLTSSGAITSTVPGMSPAQLASGMAVIPSYVTAFAINGQGGGDILMTSGFSSTLSLTLTASMISQTGPVIAKGISDNASMISLSSTIDAAGGGPISGSAAFNGSVFINGAVSITTDSVVDGNVSFSGTVSGGGSLTVTAGTGRSRPRGRSAWAA